MLPEASSKAFLPNDLRLKTLGDHLAWASRELAALGPEESQASAERLLQDVTGLERFKLYLEPASPLTAVQTEKYKRFVQRRKNREPVSYILGKAYFWNQQLEVHPGCLIPRPETEILVESFIGSSGFGRQDEFMFLDLGSGSGAIGIAILAYFEKAFGIFSDVSEEALSITRRNLRMCRLENRSKAVLSDCFKSLRGMGRPLDAIVSNPPYVTEAEWAGLQPEIFYEPRKAFVGGADGLDFYCSIAQEAPAFLKQGGVLGLEIGAGQAPKVTEKLELSFADIRIYQDHAGIERVILAKRK